MKVTVGIAILLTMGLSGCATIITEGNLPRIETLSPITGPRGSIAVRSLNVFEGYKGSGKEHLLTVEVNTRIQRDIIAVVKDSGYFSRVEEIAEPPKGKPPEAGDIGALERYLGANLVSGSDYFLDVYTYSTSVSPDNWLILPYMAWAAIHLCTLGLVPLWMPHSLPITAILYEKSGKIIGRFELEGGGNQWTWSPLILNSHSKKSNDPTLLEEFHRNTFKTLLNQLERAHLFGLVPKGGNAWPKK